MTCTVERGHVFTIQRREGMALPGQGRPGEECLTIAGSQGPPPGESHPRGWDSYVPIHL